MNKWLSAIRTGRYSDTSIFIIDVFDTELKARTVAVIPST